MAVNRDPILKRCRYLGIEPGVVGVFKKSNRNPNANARRKVSEYGIQLKEKQKLKFIYGVLEKPFHHYFELASKMEGQAGNNLITVLESRLDNIAFRMGLALTRREARQLVTHGHFTVNGKKVDIPSYRVKVGDVIALRDKSKSSAKFKDLLEKRLLSDEEIENLKNKAYSKSLFSASDYPVLAERRDDHKGNGRTLRYRKNPVNLNF